MYFILSIECISLVPRRTKRGREEEEEHIPRWTSRSDEAGEKVMDGGWPLEMQPRGRMNTESLFHTVVSAARLPPLYRRGSGSNQFNMVAGGLVMGGGRRTALQRVQHSRKTHPGPV